MNKREVVLEHIGWCRSQGWRAVRVVESVGPRPRIKHVGWDEAVTAISQAYDELNRAERLDDDQHSQPVDDIHAGYPQARKSRKASIRESRA